MGGEGVRGREAGGDGEGSGGNGGGKRVLGTPLSTPTLQFSAKTHFSYDTYVSCYFVNHMQVRHLRNRLRVNMVCEWVCISIPGERDLPKSLGWCSRLELRSHVQVRTYARTHTGKPR